MWQRELAERRQDAADAQDAEYWTHWQEAFQVAKDTTVLAMCWKPQWSPVPPAAWYGTGLTAVRLPGMDLEQLPNTFDKRHAGIVDLILPSNRLSKLPRSVRTLTNLVEINITKNQFRRLPKWLCSLKRLQRLELAANKLVKVRGCALDVSVLGGCRLAHVTLTDTRTRTTTHTNTTTTTACAPCLCQLPKDFGKLRMLPRLVLEHNRLRKLPSSMAKMRRLERLSLSYNRFVHLPAFVSTLSGLTSLSLNNNRVRHIPEHLTHMHRLRHLSLGNNFIHEVPDGIANMTNLRSLWLDWNEIKRLPITMRFMTRVRPMRGARVGRRTPSPRRLTHARTPARTHARTWQLGSLKVAGNPLEQPSLELVGSEDAKGTRQWCWDEFARREKARVRGTATLPAVRTTPSATVVAHAAGLTRHAATLAHTRIARTQHGSSCAKRFS